MTVRRRRGLVLLSLAVASGGLAASRVHEQEQRLGERAGPAVDVLVAARDLRAGARVRGRDLAVRSVPARFVPPDALASAAGVAGARTAVPVAAGGYVTAGVFHGSSGVQRGEGGLGRGERAVTVAVAAGPALHALAPGTRVDVLVSTEPGAAGARTSVALAGTELLRLEPGAAGAADGYADRAVDMAGPAGRVADARATLRVSLRQAVYLTAADNFAREIRLLARPAGDRSAAGVEVAQGEL